MRSKTFKQVQGLRNFAYYYEELRKISRALHYSDECACNYGLTSRQKTRRDNLMVRAGKLAGYMGLIAYHQGDPRGCSLYLVNKQILKSDNYTDGIPVLW